VINQGINVPDNTIAVFNESANKRNFDLNQINTILNPLDKKRDWFTPHFYKCLPLAIGNQYGFAISAQYDFSFEWNGSDHPSSLKFFIDDENAHKMHPQIMSHFGSGVISINPPFVLRTPPGINLMTINPPNYVIPNVTVMTGVVEADNIRRNFTFNLKVQMPNIRVHIKAGAPLAAFIPIPRYFVDGFSLKSADEIFSQEIIQEEERAAEDAYIHRNTVELKSKAGVGRHYFQGIDIYGNNFPDHQHAINKDKE
jgi:hypothetical protein